MNAPIGRLARGPGMFPAIMPDGKPAQSDVRRLAGNDQATLVAVQIHTGRTHQVRLHLASIGLPIIGDPLHGTMIEAVAGEGMGLHAWRLELSSGPEALRLLEAPTPARLAQIAAYMGLAFSDRTD